MRRATTREPVVASMLARARWDESSNRWERATHAGAGEREREREREVGRREAARWGGGGFGNWVGYIY